MFEIKLPNPLEMSIPEFFSQMRVVLKAAEKSYQEMTKGIELIEDNTPWIRFELDKSGLKLTDEQSEIFDENQNISLKVERP